MKHRTNLRYGSGDGGQGCSAYTNLITQTPLWLCKQLSMASERCCTHLCPETLALYETPPLSKTQAQQKPINFAQGVYHCLHLVVTQHCIGYTCCRQCQLFVCRVWMCIWRVTALVLAEGEQPRRMLCHHSCLDSKLARISSNEIQHCWAVQIECGKELLKICLVFRESVSCWAYIFFDFVFACMY